MEILRAAVALIVRSMVVSAQSAGQQRLFLLQRAVAAGEQAGELARLRDENRQLKSENQLLRDFAVYYNECRGHTRLGGAVPSIIHRGEQWTKPAKSAKAVPANVGRRVSADTQITAYRVAA